MRFALQGAPDISAQAQWQDGAWQVCAQSPAGQIQYRLQIAGRHHVKNSLAALAACLGAGVPLADIAQGLEQFVAVAGRCRAVQLQWGARHLDLIDDSYNANPDSVCAAIDVLAELPGPHLLVLGDMGEVGNQGEEFHTEVGEYAAERGIETLYALGDLMRYTAAAFPGARHFANMNSLQVACLRDAPQYRSILVKGSRFMRMESVIAALQAAAQASKEEGGAYVA
jgi:UDP-N-acetylmuramoyl-tripeptide--D-alanyl-D-alanine ligase